MSDLFCTLLPYLLLLLALFFGFRSVAAFGRKNSWGNLVELYKCSAANIPRSHSSVLYFRRGEDLEACRFMKLGCNDLGFALAPELMLRIVVKTVFVPWEKVVKAKKKQIWFKEYYLLVIDGVGEAVAVPASMIRDWIPTRIVE